MARVLLYLVLVHLFINVSVANDDGSIPKLVLFFVALTGVGVYDRFIRVECEYTDDIASALERLQDDLEYRVFGQDLATTIVVKALKNHHDRSNSPDKALAMSFHGTSGSGKNYVSTLIAKNLYKNGGESKSVHFILGSQHFPHKQKVEEYKQLLKEWISGNVTTCPKSLFVFDEVDKWPEGLVDVIKPYLDPGYTKVDNVDYRYSTFIFLTNTGAVEGINTETLNNWIQGKSRDEITLKRMEGIIKWYAFNKEGGLWHSTLIKAHAIDFFVPFLPLERKHIKKCIKVELRKRNRTIEKKLVDEIADEMTYFPKDHKVFSESGCKKVGSKVTFKT